MKKILQLKGVRRCGKILGGLVLIYVLVYSALSIFGCYQPLSVGTFEVKEFAWAPFGFYDPDHAWKGSSYAVHHPTEKTGGWHGTLTWAFLPLWTLDCGFIHTGPRDAEIERRFPAPVSQH